MKTIFAGIGVIMTVFSIFFFLLVVDKMPYQNDTATYQFNLYTSISGLELQKIAEEVNVTARIIYYKNTSFGSNDIEVVFINPVPSVHMGKQPSIFPKDNIVYQILDVTSENQIQYFTVLNDDEKKIEKVKLLLESIGAVSDISRNEPVSFSIGMLFSSLNLRFFSLLTLLLILCNAIYYVYRMKEIGVLKLNGWNSARISYRLLLGLLIRLYLFSLLLAVPFAAYVTTINFAAIILFAKIYILLCFFLAVVFIASVFVGTFFIRKVNQVSAIKNKRNNKLIFNVLLAFKIVTTTLLVVSTSNMVENIHHLDSIIQAISKMEQYEFYTVNTSVTPEDSLQTELNQFIGAFADSSLYNYDVPLGNHRVTNLNSLQLQSAQKQIETGSLKYTAISPNILNCLDVIDEKGNKVSVLDINPQENALLIPIHYSNEISTILAYLGLDDDTRTIYIQNGQVQNVLTRPGLFTYDSIYYIHPVQKTLYLNSGHVLMDNESAHKLKQELTRLGVDAGSISVNSLSSEYGIFKGNAQLSLYESLFHMTINLLSFALCVVSIVTIFIELRKKEIGVYKLVGKYPITVLASFIGLNWVSTVLIALVVNPIFILLILPEGAIHGTLVSKYMHTKAVLALKGE